MLQWTALLVHAEAALLSPAWLLPCVPNHTSACLVPVAFVPVLDFQVTEKWVQFPATWEMGWSQSGHPQPLLHFIGYWSLSAIRLVPEVAL